MTNTRLFGKWSKRKVAMSKQLFFWRMAEVATNETLRNLFLSNNNNFPYLLGFDNDKIHFCYAKDTKMEGLSPQHHVKDNRCGLTLHTCAYPATCVLVAVNFQCIGEGVEDTYVWTVWDIFGIGPNGHINLRNVTLASDRGYWEKSLLFSDFLEGGANVVGTVKRVSFFVECKNLLSSSFVLLVFFLVVVVICCRRHFFLL